MQKTVLITGASRGLGRALAEEFARNNYRVVLNYRQAAQRAHALARQLRQAGCTVLTYGADVTQREQVEAMVQQVGSIDVLLNNAGIAQSKLFTQVSELEWETMLEVHLKGMFNCCQVVLPQMLKRQSGKIINISSVWGLVGAACEVPYSTAKAGMLGFTKALAKEVALSGIQVNCIAPGVLETEMNNQLTAEEKKELCQQIPQGRFGQPEEIAYLALFLASTRADYITGQVISPNGGFVL